VRRKRHCRGRVGERGAVADDGPGCFDVGGGSHERVDGVDVTTAGGPVQRCLGVATDAGCVGIGTGRGLSVLMIAATFG
jgi:hypothetical protein